MGERRGIEAMVDLLNEAFDGAGIESSNESQAFLTNLDSVSDGSWRALPAGLSRSIESIALHVGSCKVMYDDYAFGSATFEWGTPAVEPWGTGAAPRAEVVPWIVEAHRRLVSHVGALEDDDDLDVPRPTNWGELRPTRWIIAAMVTHDAYHAGEINHLRSLLDGDDRWQFVQEGFG